jgi:RNA polymerase sigma factor (sigma-70 family)
MGAKGLNSVVNLMRRVVLMSWEDAELLDALSSRRDEAAFEVLLGRHGPMVLGVCRRVLRNDHDAEDAFQATFLVLVRKASSIRKGAALGSWLYGIAYRTAKRAKASATRQRLREREVAAHCLLVEAVASSDLDEELNALSEKYRAPVVLCELQGRSRSEVARQLNIPEGTLSSRLATARRRLAKQLARNGWDFPPLAGTCALPMHLAGVTTKVVALALTGQTATGIISTRIAALSEGIVKAMFLNKLQALTAACLILGVIGFGVGQAGRLAWGQALSSSPQAESSAKNLPPQGESKLEALKATIEAAKARLALEQAELARNETSYQNLLHQRGNKEIVVRAQALASRLCYRIPVEIGRTQTKGGAHIEIKEVWGTRPKIEVGGYYMVHGQYVLPSQQGGTICFRETCSGPAGSGPNLDLQNVKVEKGKGEFTLLHVMLAPGYFHLQLHSANDGDLETYADMYFGTGENVWKMN